MSLLSEKNRVTLPESLVDSLESRGIIGLIELNSSSCQIFPMWNYAKSGRIYFFCLVATLRVVS